MGLRLGKCFPFCLLLWVPGIYNPLSHIYWYPWCLLACCVLSKLNLLHQPMQFAWCSSAWFLGHLHTCQQFAPWTRTWRSRLPQHTHGRTCLAEFAWQIYNAGRTSGTDSSALNFTWEITTCPDTHVRLRQMELIWRLVRTFLLFPFQTVKYCTVSRSAELGNIMTIITNNYTYLFRQHIYMSIHICGTMCMPSSTLI